MGTWEFANNISNLKANSLTFNTTLLIGEQIVLKLLLKAKNNIGAN